MTPPQSGFPAERVFMAANPQVAAAWNAAPLTKFRPPRVRRDAICRPQLLARLQACIAEQPLTLICAPGGFGKTSLLAQLAASTARDAALVWIAVDEDDDDAHRFFVALVRAIEPLDLAWESPPATLMLNAAGSASQRRAALASVVNALCTASARRIVFVFDDLHRIASEQVFELLEAFIERLPDHAAIVLASRVEPALPLARWRAHGELADFVPWDLQFTESEAAELAAARLGASLEPESVRNVWRRMHGWAAGLTIALQAPRHGALRSDAPSSGGDADRHLYAYLAQEILSDLPDDMREFVLACSVLAELSPPACDAVAGTTNAKQMLEALYRRNLFVTATDDAIPVLRFHDLFRDFLLAELERRHPQRVKELHARAGRTETCLTRAVAHFVRAELWPEAMHALAANGEAMLADGDHAMLERWLDQLPLEARRTDAKLSYLRGVCAWLRWDWRRAREELEPAIAGLSAAPAARVRAMFLLADAFNSSGDRERSWAMLEELARLPLDRLARAQLALQRAWCLMPAGDPDGVGAYLHEFIAEAEQDAGLVCPRTADRIHLLCIGLPRVAQAFQRYFSLCENLTDQTSAPWRLAALAVGAWGYFWCGRREPLPAILQQGEALHQKFGGMRLVSERLLQFRTLYYAASGQFEAATTLSRKLIAALQTPEAAAHRAVWLRAYQHALARMYWMAHDYENFRALAPTLLAPRLPTEWPFMETAIELMRGQLAILREDWRTAESALDQSIRTHRRHRLPMTHGDPRVTLAWMHSLRNDESKSWETFAPVLTEVLEQEAPGLLLLEPAFIVDELLKLTPPEIRRSDAYAAFAARLALWRPDQGAQVPQAAQGPLAALSEREREVLAQVAAGASNKHIARDLALSLHTVKRHIANILDKLDCASRGQAADLYRRAQLG